MWCGGVIRGNVDAPCRQLRSGLKMAPAANEPDDLHPDAQKQKPNRPEED